MRTPGHDEELAAGLVLSEGIVRERSGIRNVFTRRSGSREHNEVVVELADGVEADTERMARSMYMSSSCGVCGKTSMEALRAAGCERRPMVRR